jgi:limonene-1,2-epoxide hydrolase
MTTPTQTVTDFLATCEQPGGLDEAIRRYFRPDTVWENVGMATTTGPDEAIALMAGFAEQFGMATMRVENLAVAETGNKVLTERIDHFIDPNGKAVGAFAVMGIFEVEDGKIAAWRDYFDTASALGQE